MGYFGYIEIYFFLNFRSSLLIQKIISNWKLNRRVLTDSAGSTCTPMIKTDPNNVQISKSGLAATALVEQVLLPSRPVIGLPT